MDACIDPTTLGELMDDAFATINSTAPDPIVWRTVHKDKLITIENGEIFGLKNVLRSGLPVVNCVGDDAATIKAAVCFRIYIYIYIHRIFSSKHFVLLTRWRFPTCA